MVYSVGIWQTETCMTSEPTMDNLKFGSQYEEVEGLQRNLPIITQQRATPHTNYKFRIVVSFWSHFLCWVRMFCLCCFFLWFALGTVGGPLFERFLGDLKWNIPILEPWMIIHILWVYLPPLIGWTCCSFEANSSHEKHKTKTPSTAIDTIQAHIVTKDDSRHIQEQTQKNQRLAGKRARALQ